MFAPQSQASDIAFTRSIKKAHMYTAPQIANFFLHRAAEEGKPMEHLKLQKMVYIAYGWGLAVLDEKLFSEPIEAWKHGPVVASLYHEFKESKDQPINHFSIMYDLDNGNVCAPHIPQNDKDTLMVLEKVWKLYNHFSGWDLREKTHEAGTPWSETYDKYHQNKPIPDELIKSHFQQKIEEYLNAAEEH